LEYFALTLKYLKKNSDIDRVNESRVKPGYQFIECLANYKKII